MPALPVSIVGTGAVTAAGHGVTALWQAILTGVPLARRVSPDRYDTKYLNTRTAALIDSPPRHGLSHRAAGYALDAIEEATHGDLHPNTALFVGTSLGPIDLWEPWHSALCLNQNVSAPSETLHGDTARVISNALSLNGPAVTFSTACTSSSAALIEAVDALRLGEIDNALVVGVDVITPFVHTGFDRLGALAPDDSPPSPFGLDRNGMWLGEAAVAIVLSRDDKHPLATVKILGGGYGTDGVHMTAPDREGKGLSRAIEQALGEASVCSTDIGWVSAHATATVFNDAMEATAFAKTLPPGVKVHGAKPVTGHTLGACGALEILLSVEVLRRSLCPPTVTTRRLDPALGVHLDADVTALDRDVVLTVNSAMAGHNTAVLLGRT